MSVEELAQEYMALRDSLHQLMANAKGFRSPGVVRHQEQMTARKNIVEEQLFKLCPDHAIFTSRIPSRAKFVPYRPRRKS